MSRPRPKVSTAPIAVTSGGHILVNAYQLGTKDDLHAVVRVAKNTRLPVFVGVVVPVHLRPRFVREADDAFADVVGG